MSLVPRDAAERAEESVPRAWVLAQIVDWLDTRPERFLLITGEPGSGKTIIAAWLAGIGGAPAGAPATTDMTRVREAIGAVHFCVARGQRGTVEPGRFARSIATQLANRYDAYADAAIERIAPTHDIHQEVRENWGQIIGVKTDTLIVEGRSVTDVYDRSVREPLRVLATSNPSLTVLVLVDALDEALVTETPNILTLLAGSGDLPPGVRFIVTTRIEPRVIDHFGDAHELALSSDARAGAVDADIRDFLLAQVARGVLPNDAVDLLVEQAAGNFLYIAFLLDEVATGRRAAGELTGLPRGLHGLYREYLDRLMPDMASLGSSQGWLDRYQPLLGSLSVAVPAAPEVCLPRWLDWPKGDVLGRLDDLVQVTEYIPADDGAYRLYHRSMADFLLADRSEGNGRPKPNRYFVDPRQQHDRIATSYLRAHKTQWGEDWGQCDAYGLRHLVGHLRARVDLADAEGAADPQAVKQLYEVAFDRRFRDSQRDKLRDPFVTLLDLRTTLELALHRHELVPILRAVAAYRETVESSAVADAIFDLVSRGRHDEALALAARYDLLPQAGSWWSRLLRRYLAWEAAEAGDAEAARQAAASANKLTYDPGLELGDALLTRAARALARDGADPASWLRELGYPGGSEWMLAAYREATPLDGARRAEIEADINAQLHNLRLSMGNSPQGVSMDPFLDDEATANRAGNLKTALVSVAWHPSGHELIMQAVELVAPNPYPRYRDIALVALGVAATAVPDAGAARACIQAVLRAGLEREGAAFTFDLPAVLAAEADHRGINAFELRSYLGQAAASNDAWGSAPRAHSAWALASFFQGKRGTARGELELAAGGHESSSPPAPYGALAGFTVPLPPPANDGAAGGGYGGYGGYATVAHLSYFDRAIEVGSIDVAFAPIWGPNHDRGALDAAAAFADTVRDPDFRVERLELVRVAHEWPSGGDPDPADIDATLAALWDPDVRNAYRNRVAALWTAAGRAERIASLLLGALGGTTMVDALLGRYVGALLPTVADDDLATAIEVCRDSFCTERPWEGGMWDFGPA